LPVAPEARQIAVCSPHTPHVAFTISSILVHGVPGTGGGGPASFAASLPASFTVASLTAASLPPLGAGSDTLSVGCSTCTGSSGSALPSALQAGAAKQAIAVNVQTTISLGSEEMAIEPAIVR
jgi:hypothetical protein